MTPQTPAGSRAVEEADAVMVSVTGCKDPDLAEQLVKRLEHYGFVIEIVVPYDPDATGAFSEDMKRGLICTRISHIGEVTDDAPLDEIVRSLHDLAAAAPGSPIEVETTLYTEIRP